MCLFVFISDGLFVYLNVCFHMGSYALVPVNLFGTSVLYWAIQINLRYTFFVCIVITAGLETEQFLPLPINSVTMYMGSSDTTA